MKTTKPNKDVKAEAEKMLAEMLGFLDQKSIVTFDKAKGMVFVGGERIPPDRMANLKSEATFFLASDLWKLMSETIRHMAYEIMFTKSESFEDVKSGKMLLYQQDVQKKLMETFRSYQQPNTPPKRTSVL